MAGGAGHREQTDARLSRFQLWLMTKAMHASPCQPWTSKMPASPSPVNSTSQMLNQGNCEVRVYDVLISDGASRLQP